MLLCTLREVSLSLLCDAEAGQKNPKRARVEDALDEADSDASEESAMGDTPDGPGGTDETKAYQAKVGRYRKHVAAVLSANEREMWLLAQANSKARGPLDRFFFWMQKQKGEREGLEPGAIAQLVLSRAAFFLQLFEGLLSPGEWSDFLDNCPLRQHINWSRFLVDVVLHNAAVFWWRVCHRMEQYPWRLFRLLGKIMLPGRRRQNIFFWGRKSSQTPSGKGGRSSAPSYMRLQQLPTCCRGDC